MISGFLRLAIEVVKYKAALHLMDCGSKSISSNIAVDRCSATVLSSVVYVGVLAIY